MSTERTGVSDGHPRNMGSAVTVTRYSVSVTDRYVFRGGRVDTSDSYQGYQRCHHPTCVRSELDVRETHMYTIDVLLNIMII